MHMIPKLTQVPKLITTIVLEYNKEKKLNKHKIKKRVENMQDIFEAPL